MGEKVDNKGCLYILGIMMGISFIGISFCACMFFMFTHIMKGWNIDNSYEGTVTKTVILPRTKCVDTDEGGTSIRLYPEKHIIFLSNDDSTITRCYSVMSVDDHPVGTKKNSMYYGKEEHWSSLQYKYHYYPK